MDENKALSDLARAQRMAVLASIVESGRTRYSKETVTMAIEELDSYVREKR